PHLERQEPRRVGGHRAQRRRRRQSVPARPDETGRMHAARCRPQGTRRDAAQVTDAYVMISTKLWESTMERRSLLQLVCAIMPISLLTTRAEAATPDQSKVVYHLSDLDKVEFVMGNIRNHYNGMGGADKVTIALVVHG